MLLHESLLELRVYNDIKGVMLTVQFKDLVAILSTTESFLTPLQACMLHPSYIFSRDVFSQDSSECASISPEPIEAVGFSFPNLPRY